MTITGIQSLRYGVTDIEKSTNFFNDFGLTQIETDSEFSEFALPDGSRVEIHDRNSKALPASDLIGDGVREVIWGVKSQAELKHLSERISSHICVEWDEDGTAHFLTDFGVAMGLRHFNARTVCSAPQPTNTPGNINRFNTHRRWARRARPKMISHVVFAVPEYDKAYQFMRDHLDFRLSDVQQGFGNYLRAPGSNNHHNILLLNAHANLPDMDGRPRFHHSNFAVTDIDEMMLGANNMSRKGWEPSHFGLGRHRIDSALFYYLPCPAGGEAEYGADSDYIDDSWVPRNWINPMFGYAHFVHNLPPFLMQEPEWKFEYLTNIKEEKNEKRETA